MTAGEQYIGRREAIGLGIETTPGTVAAAQTWLRWLTQDIQNKAEVIENESAMGVVDQVNDSAIASRWAEGTIGGKVTEEGIGFLLTGFFGLPTTDAAVASVYPHTFAMSQSSVPPSLTISRRDLLAPQTHAYVTVETLEISAEAGGWVEFSSAIKARRGVAASFTPAFVSELEFTSRHIVAKLAANKADLAAATALQASSVKLSLGRPVAIFNPLGTSDEPEFDRGTFTVAGELVIRYKDSQYEDDFLNNAIKALSVTMTNGTRSLAFTLGQVRYRELEKSTDKDEIVTQSISFKGEYSATEGKSVEVVLKNGRATYVAA